MAQEDEAQGEVQELGMSTAKRGTVYLGGKFATSLIAFVLLIILARLLGAADFGFYSIAIAFSGILALAATFGVGTAFRKMIPEHLKDHRKVSELLSNGYALSLSIGVVVAVAGYLASGLIATTVYGNQSLVLSLQLASIAEFLSVLFNLGQAATVGMHKVREATISNALYSLFTLIGSVLLVLLGYGVPGAVAGTLIGLLVGSAATLYYLMRSIKLVYTRPDKKTMKEITSFSAPMVASHIAMNGAQNFAILLLGVYAAASVVGDYSVAFKLARFVDVAITSITFILLPAFSTALSKAKLAERIGAIYNYSLYYTGLVLFPVVAYLASVSAPLIRLLFSSSYALAPEYFAFIVIGMALGLIGTYAGTLIVGQGDTRRFMRYQVGATFIQVALLFVFTPYFQALGVLVALFAITPIVLNVVYMRALEDQFKVKHTLTQFYLAALAAILLGLGLYVVGDLLHFGSLSIAVNLILLALLYPPLLGIIGAINRKNIEFIRGTAERMKPIKGIAEYFIRYSELFVRDSKSL